MLYPVDMKVDATVLIPARNAAEYLAESILSVKNQITTYTFEILIINDHSTDATNDLSEQLSKEIPNLKLLQSKGKGISNAMNTGIYEAKGQYVIRHDADDLMLNGRIQSQLDFLSKSEDFVIVGGQLIPFGTTENITVNQYPMNDSKIRKFLTVGNPFAHPTVTYRLNSIKEVGLYNPKFDGAEDYELWVRLLQIGKGANLSIPVTKYRIHSNQETKKNFKKVDHVTRKIQRNYFYYLLTKLKLFYALFCGVGIALRFIRTKSRIIKLWM